MALPALAYGLAALKAGAGYAARQGLKNFTTKVVAPALLSDIGVKTASGLSGIPESKLDTVSYAISPHTKGLANYVFGNALKVPAKAAAYTMTSGIIDALPENDIGLAGTSARESANNFYRNNFNTAIPQALKEEYNKWLQSLPEGQRSTDDYDLAGYFMAGKNGENGIKLYDRENGEHFIDRFKKPNHPTFSNESQYSSPMGFQGGRWLEGRNGWIFEPNFNIYSKEELRDYMLKNEPNASLRDRR